MKFRVGALLAASVVLCWGPMLGPSPLAAPTVGTPSLSPQVVPVGTTTVVTITTEITDPGFIPGSANLQRLDANGRVVAVVGTLRDAGGNVFTISVPLSESVPGSIFLRVSAAFRGLLKRVFSPVIVITVSEAPAPTPEQIQSARVESARVKGLAWLLTHQRGDGSWKGPAGTEVTATAAALEGLTRAGLKGYPYVAGISWLGNAATASVDSLARKIIALRQANLDVTALVQQLIAWKNLFTRTWGAYEGFETSFPDTPLALAALRLAQVSYADLGTALCVTFSAQQTGATSVAGSWPYIWPFPGSAPPPAAIKGAILPTTQNVLEVEAARIATGVNALSCNFNGVTTTYSSTTAVTNGITWLLSERRNADGGFGEPGVSTVFETALVYEVLSTLRPTDPATGAALDFLIARQGADGTWSGDALDTAYVLKVFPRPALPLVDTDKDGVPDVIETLLGTDPKVADSRWLTRGTGLNVLAALTPSSASVGGPGFLLTVDGEGFTPSSVVRWGVANRTTTFVSATRLQASIPASDLATVGTAQVTVVTPSPGAGTSSPLPFTIKNPVPVLLALTPSSATGGGAGVPLILGGQSFVASSVVRWNGGDRPTTFVSATELHASLASTDLTSTGTALVTVFTPDPGGGTSVPLVFTVTQPTAEVILDNGQPGTSFTGTWAVSSDPTSFGADSLVSAGVDVDTFRWSPTIPATSTYTVYVWWTSAPTRSTTVRYTLSYAGGTRVFTVDQQFGGGQWQLLGTFPFTSGTAGSVEVSGASGKVSADAVRFVPAGVAGALTVTKVGTGSGTVTSAPAGIYCGTDCSEIYGNGTVVILTAIAAPGSIFAGWSGDPGCAGSVLTMSDNRSCTATFNSEDILLDNGQGGTSFTGTWTVSTDPASYGGDSLVANGAGIETYRWTPSIPVTREYAVYLWWTSAPSRSTTVRYTVSHLDGEDTFLANQQVAGGQWLLLGKFTFPAGPVGFVEVSAEGDGGTVSADAVRFVPQ